MSIDDEIRQDFLVEAGELYDSLNDQLGDLEKSPQDSELLNAIFRAFHTIKGGAGFLEVTPMVQVCHRVEDIFDLLRNDKLQIDSGLMAAIYQVLDILGDMFDSLREDEELEEVDSTLLSKLDTYLNKPAAVDVPVQDSTPTETTSKSEVSMDDEFEEMRESATTEKEVVANGSDLITDDEFDSLMDDMHGKGKHKPIEEKSNEPAVVTAAASDSGLITDDEFDNLMDEMHGKDKGPGSDEAVQEIVSKENERRDESSSGAALRSPDTTQDSSEGSTVVKKKTAAKKKKETKKAESSVRVDTERLDHIMNLVGELVLVRNRLSMLKQTIEQESVTDAITTLELITTDLQSSVMKTRMQPIKKVFSRFPRVIRDLAKKLNKDINLQLIGEDTDLDKSLVEALADPMIHLVRNSADHGVEMPEERFEKGKPRQGTITLSAKQEGDQVLITVSDDGKGMDASVFRAKAVEAGMLSEEAANNLSDKDAFNLIFAPGFSTKSEISDVSGRGVGMDVVKTRINELNGNIEIDSKLGEGSVITIHLPLTLAILPTLMVKLDSYQFALPLNNVYEAFNMEPDQINVVDDQDVIRVRGETLPIFYLYPWLVRDKSFDGPQQDQKIIVVQMGSLRFCLVVDKIVGQEEVVIKPLGAMLTTTPGFSGATITGDGDIALVLDMPGLMNEYAASRAVF